MWVIMAKIKKYKARQYLERVRVHTEDTQPGSRYFQLREMPEVLHSGKNAFLIEGSENLNSSTEVLVEILDTNGDPVFNQPIPKYAEGLARVVSIEVYEDTPPGPALLTILGQAVTNEDGSPLPPQWVGNYNVRYQQRITIDPLRVNNSRIRLYKEPTLGVSEILSPYRKSVQVSTTEITGSGASTILQQVPGLTGSATFNQVLTLPTAILSRSMEGGTIKMSVTTAGGVLPQTSSIKTVLNNFQAFLDDKLAISRSVAYPISAYSISFQDSPEFSYTLLSRSLADVKLNNLTTFSGDVARARFYVRSIDFGGDFEMVLDTKLESELLTQTSSIQYGPATQMGDFVDQQVVDLFWDAGVATASAVAPWTFIANGAVTLTQDTEVLIDSVYVSSDSPADAAASSSYKEFGNFRRLVPSMSFYDELEYSLEFNAVCKKDNDAFDARMDVYLSGSAFPSTDPMGVLLTTLESQEGQIQRVFTNQAVNFVPTRDGSGNLVFVGWGGLWYTSDVTIRSSFETGFNPDQVEFIIPILGKRFENLEFKAELFDPNNNYLGFDVFSDTVYFNGGNLLIRGTDHRMEGTLTISPSGSGVTISSEGYLDEDGTPMSGSAIYTGEGRWFHKDTAILLAEDTSGNPRISFGDKLKGYIDPTTGDFVLVIVGTILTGTGSLFTDILSLIPRLPSDDFFHRIRGINLDFYDIQGKKAITAGEVESTTADQFASAEQIARMGKYTRGSIPRTVSADSPLIVSGITASFNPMAAATVTATISSSGTIDVPSDVMVWNNTLYGNMVVDIDELLLTSSAYVVSEMELVVDTSWVGYSSGSDPGTGTKELDLGGTRTVQTISDDANFWVTQTGSFSPDPFLSYPIHIPEGRPDGYNTLYVVVSLTVTTVRSTEY